MSNKKRMIMIVTADEKDAANAEAQKYDRIGGDKTFSVGMSATGEEPWTHYWCSWLMDEGDHINMKSFASKFMLKREFYDEGEKQPEEIRTEKGWKEKEGVKLTEPPKGMGR